MNDVELDEAVSNLVSEIALRIEAHDMFDCPSDTTYVKAANEIAGSLEDILHRALTRPQSASTELVEALRPFADAVDEWHESYHNNVELGQGGRRTKLTVGDLRRARKAIAKLEGKTDG